MIRLLIADDHAILRQGLVKCVFELRGATLLERSSLPLLLLPCHEPLAQLLDSAALGGADSGNVWHVLGSQKGQRTRQLGCKGERVSLRGAVGLVHQHRVGDGAADIGQSTCKLHSRGASTDNDKSHLGFLLLWIGFVFCLFKGHQNAAADFCGLLQSF